MGLDYDDWEFQRHISIGYNSTRKHLQHIATPPENISTMLQLFQIKTLSKNSLGKKVFTEMKCKP